MVVMVLIIVPIPPFPTNQRQGTAAINYYRLAGGTELHLVPCSTAYSTFQNAITSVGCLSCPPMEQYSILAGAI